MLKNCTGRLDGERDETVNYIISECNKQTQKLYQNKYEWLEKIIHLELCKKMKFRHANKFGTVFKMKRIKFSGSLIYEQITQYKPEDQI